MLLSHGLVIYQLRCPQKITAAAQTVRHISLQGNEEVEAQYKQRAMGKGAAMTLKKVEVGTRNNISSYK